MAAYNNYLNQNKDQHVVRLNTSQPAPTINTDNHVFNNTIVIFDFDDTLFPTHKVKQFHQRSKAGDCFQLFRKLSMEEQQRLIDLSLQTLQILTSYILEFSAQNIFIVTASSYGWIQNSLKNVYNIGVYSNIYHLLFDKNKDGKNNLISMIHPHSDLLPFKQYIAHNEPKKIGYQALDWKYRQFEAILKQKLIISGNVMNTFVVIGDSLFEYYAAGELQRKYCKKFRNLWPWHTIGKFCFDTMTLERK